MPSSRPVVQLASEHKNVPAIRAYWTAYAAARCWEDYARASITYLYDTDRLDERDVPHTIDKPLAVFPLTYQATMARRNDGDLTIWSDPPPWWKRTP